MFCRLKSATVIGVSSSIIDVEIDLKKGLPHQSIVGLPDAAVKEAKERVNAAIRNSGFKFPLGRLTINLAPADIKKEGSIFDLAIAVGALIVSDQISMKESVEDFIILGELSLDGFIRPIHGVLAILENAAMYGCHRVMLPCDNYEEARLISDLNLYPVGCLTEAVNVICGDEESRLAAVLQKKGCADLTGGRLKNEKDPRSRSDEKLSVDFSDVSGQNYAIRAVEVAISGGHNVLMIGSPGSGKTMIAARIPTIIPDMIKRESIETTKIYSIAGLLPVRQGLIKRRPFRAPHHTASEISIIGGGKNPIPGEITLAHNGVLFLDEFTEFKNNIIQSLRQPLETGVITVARADTRVTFPALFTLVASMNPCPCGYLFDPERACRCNSLQINKYYMKISGPILDRIDIQVEVKPLKAAQIFEDRRSDSSSVIRERVERTRKIQYERLSGYGITLNAFMDNYLVKKFCVINSRIKEILNTAVRRYRLSVRSYTKILKVARTIADLQSREKIEAEDVLEALSYREVENILYNKRGF
jgi:magnesium chelatase family protein